MADAKPKSVLFVCNLNQIRSPMAEFLVKDIYGDQIYAQSGGIEEGDVDGFMQAVMKERGIDVTNHIPRSLQQLDDTFADLVITLSPAAHRETLDYMEGQAVEIEYWPTRNPSDTVGRREDILEAYRQTRDELEDKIRERFGKS